MSGGGFKRLGEVLPRLYAKIGLAERLDEARIEAIWQEAVGKEVAARARPVKFKGGVLHVRVSHGAWLQELRFREREIARGLERKLPGLRIEAIRFTGEA